MSRKTVYACDLCGVESFDQNDHHDIMIRWGGVQLVAWKDVCADCLKEPIGELLKKVTEERK